MLLIKVSRKLLTWVNKYEIKISFNYSGGTGFSWDGGPAACGFLRPVVLLLLGCDSLLPPVGGGGRSF